MALGTGGCIAGIGRAVLEAIGIAVDPVSCVRRIAGGVCLFVAANTTRCRTCSRITAAMAFLAVCHAGNTDREVLGNTAMFCKNSKSGYVWKTCVTRNAAPARI